MSDNEADSGFAAADVVEFYARKADLYPAERAILERFRTALGGMRMLDIGVGGGRTTRYFADLAKEYVGVDLEEKMLQACRELVPERPGKLSYLRADASDMASIPADSFDFILFSMNGLDCLPHEPRLKTLAEIRRVGRDGGTFCFSAHNLNHLAELFRFRLRPFRKLPQEIRRQWKLRRANGGAGRFAPLPHAQVNDGAHDFTFSLYYVRPREQLAQLAGLGFDDVEVYLLDGRRITPREAVDDATMWFYYVCRIRKGGASA